MRANSWDYIMKLLLASFQNMATLPIMASWFVLSHQEISSSFLSFGWSSSSKTRKSSKFSTNPLPHSVFPVHAPFQHHFYNCECIFTSICIPGTALSTFCLSFLPRHNQGGSINGENNNHVHDNRTINFDFFPHHKFGRLCL